MSGWKSSSQITVRSLVWIDFQMIFSIKFATALVMLSNERVSLHLRQLMISTLLSHTGLANYEVAQPLILLIHVSLIPNRTSLPQSSYISIPSFFLTKKPHPKSLNNSKVAKHPVKKVAKGPSYTVGELGKVSELARVAEKAMKDPSFGVYCDQEDCNCWKYSYKASSSDRV